jgi:NAD(P)-dependent dehydrogenase (short-subunit alcohol dehydrogenase family)
MDGLLLQKAVIITGAGSGVGRASAVLFARHGAKVLALDIDEAAVKSTVSEVKAAGGVAEYGLCDVSDEKAVHAAVERIVTLFGRLDVMYNNAGITTRLRAGGTGTNFLEGTTEDMTLLNSVNIGGVINGCRAAIKRFRAQGGGGVIVNTASLAGLIGYGSPLYSATKGAVTTLTRSLALQFAADRIRINSVCPAAMMTNFGLSDSFKRTAEMEAWSASLFPMGRNVEPLECANAALFLASDMSSNITGVNLPVDGGISAGVKV